MTYKEAVEKGIELRRSDSDIKWELGALISGLLGDLRKSPQSREARKLISRWRHDVDAPDNWSVQSLLTYAAVYDKWPIEKRKDAAWSAHWHLSAHPRRFQIIKDGMTTQEAETRAGRRNNYHLSGKSSDHDLMRAAASYIKTVRTRVEERGGLKSGTEDLFGEDVAEIEHQLDNLIDVAGMREELGALV